ncbi:MAG: SHOCT domain-containing protein [Candidatus Dormibacterales bacterium]
MIFSGYGMGLLGLWSLLVTVFFIGGLVLLGVVAFRAVRLFDGRGVHPAARPDPALELLRHRFAAGEIDQEEFEGRRKLLQPEEGP